jgi:hypothetical protein
MKYFYAFMFFLSMSFHTEATAQNLFKSFTFQMPLDSAKEILAEEAKELKNLSFGSGTLYAVRKKSLVGKNGKLVSLNLGSKKNLNLNQAEAYLKKSRAYFESKNYNVVYAQENWSKPTLVKKNLPGIRFVDPDKTVVVEVDPRGQGSVYNVFITFYNYEWFLKKARGEE